MRQLKSDPDVTVRGAAATALGDLRADPECAVKALVEAVREDNSSHVPYEALNALGKLGPLAASGVDELVLAGKTRSSDKEFLDPTQVIETLVKLGPGTIPRLVFHLRMSSPSADDDTIGTAGIASMALEGIGKEAVQPLVRALSDPERESAALLALQSIGPVAGDAAPALVKLYRADENLRGAILHALYAMKDKACVARSLYEEVLRSPETRGVERQQAEGALANLKDCPADP